MTDFITLAFVFVGFVVMLRVCAGLTVLLFRTITAGMTGRPRADHAAMFERAPAPGHRDRLSLTRLRQQNAGLQTALAKSEHARKQLEAQLAEARKIEPVDGGDLRRIRATVARELHPDYHADKPEALRSVLEGAFKRIWPMLQPRSGSTRNS